MAVRGQDILGNIAILKFASQTSTKEKKKEALRFLSEHKNVKSVLEKTRKFSGRLRTMGIRHLAGGKNLEALYKENGCEFRLNVKSCYFSSRLASERLEIAKRVKKGENVLVMFGGVAPFAIVIAKLSKAKRVISVELGRECSKYAQINVKRNKLDAIVEIIQGNARKVLPKLKGKFDRIVMARPNLKDSFLDVAFPRVKKGGIIHYYGFYKENEKYKLIELIKDEAEKSKKRIKILKVKRAGDIGIRKFRFRLDLKVLN